MRLSISTWKTQLNILWLGQMLVLAMLAMSLPYWPLYIAQLGDYSPQEIRFWSAAIYMAPMVTAILFSPLWGKLADKYGYKRMVIRASLGLFITQTLILFFSDVYLIFIFRLLQGVLAGFSVAAQAWAIAISPGDQNGATIGKLQSATAIGGLLGPLLGGVIAAFAGYHAIFTASSLICGLITVLFFFFLQDPIKVNDNVMPKKTNEARIKATELLTKLQQQILFILLVIIFVQLARQMVTPIFALFVTEQLGGGDIAVGVLYAATGLMIFITAPYWGKFFDKAILSGAKVSYIVAGLLFISALLQVMQAYVDTVTGTFILRLLWGVCLGGLLPVLLQLLVKNSDDTKRGMFLGFGNSATKLGNLTGILLGALIEVYFGFSNSFLMTALLYFISSIVVLVYLQPSRVKN